MPEQVFTEAEVVKDPPAGTEKPPADKPAAVVEDVDPVLKGDHIPEKYRGKKVSDVAAENARLEAELAEVKSRPAQREPQPVQVVKGPNEMTLEELETLSYQNPLKASAILMQRFSAPIVQEVRETSKKLAEQSVQSLPHYKRYEKEIKENVSKAAPEAQGNPELHRRVYDLVVGSHHDELVREAITGSTGLPSGNQTKQETKKVELTAEQKSIAAKFGISEDDYRANM